MGDVIDLDAMRPHYAGPASCLKCRHEWTAVAPVDVDLLQCGNCGEMMGVLFGRREVFLAQALESIMSGTSGEGARVDVEVMREIARDALIGVGYGNYAKI